MLVADGFGAAEMGQYTAVVQAILAQLRGDDPARLMAPFPDFLPAIRI